MISKNITVQVSDERLEFMELVHKEFGINKSDQVLFMIQKCMGDMELSEYAAFLDRVISEKLEYTNKRFEDMKSGMYDYNPTQSLRDLKDEELIGI